ncbi:MAG: hypothetical protein AB8G05_09585 [Oligoflexales bacterium]
MLNKLRQPMLGALLLSMISCGGEEQQYVKNFEYGVGDNDVSLGLEFNSDLTLNTDLTVPILDYGFVHLIANDNQYGFRIKTDLNLEALVDPEILNLSTTRNLPNEQSMTSYVETDVAKLWIKASDEIAANVYFGLEPDQFYFGVALELGFIDDDFPAGLVISQRIRDAKQRMLGVVTLYGPEVKDGIIIKPGGLFFISNVNELRSYLKDQRSQKLELTSLDQEIYSRKVPVIFDENTFINQPRYNNLKRQYELFKLFKRKGKKAGLMD